MRRSIWAGAAGLLLACATLAPGPAAQAQPAAADPPVAYEVRAGDTLYDLATRYLVRLADYAEVQRLNAVRDPRRLPIGHTLLIPPGLLRSEEIVGALAAFRGAVTIEGAGAVQAPVRGMPIREGYRLVTAAGSFLTIELPDQSRITLPSNSTVRVSRLRRILLTQSIDRSFHVETGRTSAVVTPIANVRDRFTITTPLAVSAVRGTEFRTNYDAERAISTVEVVEGHVGSQGPDAAELVLNAGFGAAVTKDGSSPAQALLAKPQIVRGGLTQDEPTLAFPLQATPGAARYRAQIAADAGFIDLLAEAEAAKSENGPRVSLASIPNGTYFVRFTAIDAQTLEGLPATYAFERRLNSLAADEPKSLDGAKRRFLFKWRSEGEGAVTYRFVLAPEAGGAAVVDQSGLSGNEIVITDLPEGAYAWRVLVTRLDKGARQDRWSPPQRFEVGS